MQDLIAIVSFIMAVLGGLSAMFSRHRDKQTMGWIIGVVFLVAFFLLVDKEARLIFQAACLILFALAVTGGIVTLRSDQEDTRVAATITGIVSLGTSLLILFTYL